MRDVLDVIASQDELADQRRGGLDEEDHTGNEPTVQPPAAVTEVAIPEPEHTYVVGLWQCLAEKGCEDAQMKEPFEGPTHQQVIKGGTPLSCPRCGGTIIISVGHRDKSA